MTVTLDDDQRGSERPEPAGAPRPCRRRGVALRAAHWQAGPRPHRRRCHGSGVANLDSESVALEFGDRLGPGRAGPVTLRFAGRGRGGDSDSE